MASGTIKMTTNDSGTGYCKMPDGTMICWGQIVITGKAGTARGNGGLYTAEFSGTLATFAKPFISRPNVTMSANRNGYSIVCCAEWNATAITYAEIGRPTSGDVVPALSYIAIGRWK